MPDLHHLHHANKYKEPSLLSSLLLLLIHKDVCGKILGLILKKRSIQNSNRGLIVAANYQTIETSKMYKGRMCQKIVESVELGM